MSPGSFQTLNKLLHNNPNLTFKIESKLQHKNTVDSNTSNEKQKFGRYLTVNTNFGNLNKLKTQKDINNNNANVNHMNSSPIETSFSNSPMNEKDISQ